MRVSGLSIKGAAIHGVASKNESWHAILCQMPSKDWITVDVFCAQTSPSFSLLLGKMYLCDKGKAVINKRCKSICGGVDQCPWPG